MGGASLEVMKGLYVLFWMLVGARALQRPESAVRPIGRQGESLDQREVLKKAISWDGDSLKVQQRWTGVGGHSYFNFGALG